MSVVVFAPARSSQTPALVSALRAGLGVVRSADHEDAVVAACEQGGRALVLDLRSNGAAQTTSLDALRRACPTVPVCALLEGEHAPPVGCDVVFRSPFYLEDVVRWCSRVMVTPVAERLLGDLAAGLCHEIGNPLTSLFLQLDLLKADETSETVSEHLALIEDAARRIQSVVRDVAQAAESHPIRGDTTDLAQLLQRAAERLGERSPDLAQRVDVSSDEMPLRADADLLTRALSDVWEYLLRAGDDEARLDVAGRRSDQGALIRHKASAPRLPEDAAARLFTPLWARQALGLAPGISLTTARSAFLRHGGELRAHAGPRGLLWVEALLPDTARAPLATRP